LQKIAIFGDSYAVSGNIETFGFQQTWVDLLSNNFDTQIFSQTGCGPDLQLERFIDYFNIDRSNDIVIFVLPHHLRLSLTGLDIAEHVYSFVYLHHKVKGISQKIKNRLNALLKSNRNNSYEEYKMKYGKFLDLWYEYFLKSNTYLETEPLKIAALVSKYRKFCKQIILLPIHPISNNNKILLCEDNFFISDLTLRLLDESENININEIVENNGIDKRAGHLNKDNHIKVYKHLKEIIDGKIHS
jgi:hypothetical protein